MTEAVIYGGMRRIFVGLRVWLRALRPESFPVSVVPAILGIAIAWQRGYRIDPLTSALTIAGALSIHSATNLLQDYFDFASGLDREGTLGGSGVLVSGSLAPRAILTASLVLYAVSAIVAGYLIYASGILLVWIALAGCVAGTLYAVPRYGLKYNMLGDAGVFAAFGVGITLGSYSIQAGSMSAYPLIYAMPFGLIVVAVLHANNMRDAKDDFEAGLKNPAYRMGPRASRSVYVALTAGAYLIPTAAVFAGAIPRGALAVLVTFPLALKLMRAQMGAELGDGAVLAPLVTRTALLALAFGTAMVCGIFLFGVVGG